METPIMTQDNVQTQMPQLNDKGGIAIPAIMWFAGVPFFFVLLLWLFFFRG